MAIPRKSSNLVFHADSNTYADIPGIPQVPAFPLQTGTPWYQGYMESMSPETREAFVFFHYYAGDPVDHSHAGARFHLLHAADLYEQAEQAVPANPVLYSFNMTLAETAISAGQLMLTHAMMTDPTDQSLDDVLERALKAGERAKQKAEPHIQLLIDHWAYRRPDWIQYPDGDIVKNTTPGTMTAILDFE